MHARTPMIAVVTTVAMIAGLAGTALAGTAPVATAASAGAAAVAKSESFNGRSTMVTVHHTAELKLAHAMTLEAWVWPTSTLSGRRDIIVKTRRGGGFPYGLETTDRVPDAYATIGGRVVKVRASSALSLDTWSFVEAAYDGAQLRLFVDGSQVASISARGDLSTSSGPVQVGGDSVWGRHFSGLIDDARVYSRALATTVKTPPLHHPRPKPTPPTTPTTPTTTTTPTGDGSAPSNSVQPTTSGSTRRMRSLSARCIWGWR